MFQKICSCFGHSVIKVDDGLKDRVDRTVDGALDDGVRVFLFGGLSDFDDLVYDIVTSKREQFPSLNIERIFCFALDKQAIRPPHWFAKKEYEGFECPKKAFDYWYKAIYYRNCAMIDMSDLVLFYAENRERSGAYKAYKYAQKAGKQIVNFANLHD